MSLGYSISVVIALEYSQESILLILNRIASIGGSFKIPNLHELDPKLYQDIELDEAAKLVFWGLPEAGLNMIAVNYKDTFVNLHFINVDNDTFSLMFTNFKYPWLLDEQNSQNYYLDLDPYIRFMLDVIKKIRVLMLEVKKS